MTAERVKEALKREEIYLLEIQKAAGRQLAVLKAERVILERQILHHEDDSSNTPIQRCTVPVVAPSLSQVELPELKLDIIRKSNDTNVSIEEEDEDM